MNPTPGSVPPPLATTPPPPPGAEEPVSNPVAALLKAPRQIAETLAAQTGVLRTAGILLAAALGCHAVFGLALGFFAGGSVALMDAVKAPAIALCALLLCLPSLYVFTSVSGSPLSLAQTCALGSACLAMIGLLLVGLAPVIWLFAVSTASLSFMTMLGFVIWVIALCFAGRFVGRLKTHPAFQRQSGIRTWFFIFAIVTLQMTTYLRPLLAKPADGWRAEGKMFFLGHFGSTFETKKQTP
jgi:hypothetical protein